MKLTYITRDIENIEAYAKSIVIPGRLLYHIYIKMPIDVKTKPVVVILSFCESEYPKRFRIEKGQKFADKPIESFENMPEEYDFVEGLTHLAVSKCGLKTLKGVPSTVLSLECNSNKEIVLDVFPKNLTNFSCRYCNLPTIPILPQTLTHFDCSYNHKIKTLPALPNLKFLFCTDTSITTSELAKFPNLISLSCSDTKLVNFIGISKTVKYIFGRNIETLESLEGLPAEPYLDFNFGVEWTQALTNLRLDEYNRKRSCLEMEPVDTFPKNKDYEQFLEQYNIWLYSPGNPKYLESKVKINEINEDSDDEEYQEKFKTHFIGSEKLKY